MKKNKKGFEKTTDFIKSIGTRRFKEDNLFISLKSWRNSNILALRVEVKLVNKKQILVRVSFLDKNLSVM